MRSVASPFYARHSLGPWRLALIAIGLLVAPVVLAVEASRGAVQTGFAIASTGALVCVLVLIRLSISGRAYQIRAAREHAARVASQAMVSAVTPADVVAGTRDALRPLKDGNIDVTLVERRAVPHPAHEVVSVGGDDDLGELAVPLSGTDMALVFAAAKRKLFELADLLRSLADQASVAVQRIGLAEAAGAEERERYFRTLVTTSTDVILISRNGRIEYATPSASSIFGRDVLGEGFDDVIRPADPGRIGARWSDVVDGDEAVIRRAGGDDVAVVIHRRDLSGDPTVRGIVTTLRDVTAERALQRDLAYRASHDELTGMVNARAWGETLSLETDRRRGPGDAVAVIFIDIDDFKSVNDHYGHPTGDRVLADVARRIRECLRAGDIAARVGGDEFAVLLHGLPNVEDARVVAQRLADTLSRPARIDSMQIDCKASIGLSYSEGQERIEALVRQADTALYAAKEQGKGRWTEYNGSQWAPARRTVTGAIEQSTKPAGP
jgi:diguanylate cyclase (GGDEF)-like protein/PAS domain S-box-containing protein